MRSSVLRTVNRIIFSKKAMLTLEKENHF